MMIKMNVNTKMSKQRIFDSKLSKTKNGFLKGRIYDIIIILAFLKQLQLFPRPS